MASIIQNYKNREQECLYRHRLIRNFVSLNHLIHRKQSTLFPLLQSILDRCPQSPRSEMQKSQLRSVQEENIADLISRGRWTVIYTSEDPISSSILITHFSLTMKPIENRNPRFKASFVVIGHHDSARQFLVHNTKNFPQHSTKRMIKVANILGFRVRRHDVSKACVQCKEQI